MYRKYNYAKLNCIVPALIAGGAAIAGGIMASRSQEDANQLNAQISADQLAAQKEFAQQGVRWKVKDAKKAGLHPLAALGANTISYTPQSVGRQQSVGDYGVSKAGQNISRAIAATATSQEKRIAEEQIKGLQLDNQEKRLRIARMYETPSMPEYTSPEFGGSGSVIIEPAKQTQKRTPGVGAANPALDELYEHESGSNITGLQQGASESFENDWIKQGQLIFLRIRQISKAHDAWKTGQQPPGLKALQRSMDKKDGYIHLLDPHTGIWNKYKKTKSNRNQLFSKRFKSKEERRFKPTKRPKYKKGQKIYKRSFNWSPGGA